MAPRLLLVFAVTMCLSAVRCVADEPEVGSESGIQPLTRGSAAEILANADSVAEGLERMIKNPGNPRDEAIFSDVRDVMAHSSEWRWYSRDKGILLAIPVRERLGIADRATAEDQLADIVRRLIYQKGWANPPVQVVFIEPEMPLLRSCRATTVLMAAECGCR